MKHYFTLIRDFLTKNTSSKQTVIKNTFWLLLAEGVSKGSTFLLTMYLAIKLGAEQFGILSYVLSFVGFFIIFSEMGLIGYMTREISKDIESSKKYYYNLSILKSLFSIVGFILLIVFAYGFEKGNLLFSYIIIYGLYGLINSLNDFLRSFFRPYELFEYEVLLKVINGILLIAIVFLFMYKNGSLSNILYAYLVSSILNFIITTFYVLKKIDFLGGKLDLHLIKKAFRSVMIIGSGNILVSVYMNIDQIFLGKYDSAVNLGLYSFAYKITLMYLIFSSAVFTSILPKLGKLIDGKNAYRIYNLGLKKIAIINTLVIFMIIILIYIISSFQLINLGQYNQSLNIMMILFLYCLFEPIGYRAYINLVTLNNESKALFAFFICASVNVIGNYLLIPVMSYHGAIITTIVSYFLFFIILHYFITNIYKSGK